MNELTDQIRMAQVEAGENAVIERLRAKGLMPPVPAPINWRGELADMYQRYTGALGEADSAICDDVINHELGRPEDCDCEGERIRALIEQPSS